MSLAIPKRLRVDVPPPQDFADAVELYARRSNRHGTLEYVPPPVNCWVVKLTLRADDPAMRAVQVGEAEAPTEIVYLWRDSTPRETAKAGRHHYVGYKLDELGVSGLIEYLERTNTTTGRGEYTSHAQAVKAQDYKGEKAREKLHQEHRANVRDLAEYRRRTINEIPYLGVGIELGPKPAPEKP